MPKHTWYRAMRVHSCVLHILRSFSANQALHAPANSKINKDQATTEPQHVHVDHGLRTADSGQPRRFTSKPYR